MGLSTASAVVTAVGALYSAYESNEEGKAKQNYYNQIAKQYEASGLSYQKQGAAQANQLRKQGKKTQSAQRAAMAANGIAADTSATGQSVITDTAYKVGQDEANVKYNADVQAYQMYSQANSYRVAAKNARKKGRANVWSSLITGASSVLSGLQ